MTRAKKNTYYLIACCIVAVVGGLTFGELGAHHLPILAAIAVIVTFGIGISLIFLMGDEI